MIENWFYIIPNIFFGILLLLAIKKFKKGLRNNQKNYLPLFLVSIYFLSSLLIYFIDPIVWYPSFHQESYTASNFTIYSAFLFIFLFPSLYLKPIDKNIIIPKTKMLGYIMIIMSLLGLYSLFYQLPYALMGLYMGAADLRLKMNIEGFQLLPQNLWTTLAVGISYFYIFYLAMLFLSVLQRRHFLIRIGLLIGSISYIISGLTFQGRDVFIFYTLGFLFIYLYFYNVLDKNIRHKANIIIFFLGGGLIFGVLHVSMNRFSNESNYSLAYGTIGYIAQQPFVFSETIERQKEFYNGDLRFPLFKSIYGNQKKIIRFTPYEWSFGTFIKDFFATGGYVFLIVMTVLFFFVFFIKIRNSHKISFYQKLIVTVFYFQFMSMGIFYFKMGSRAGNIYILILLILYFVVAIKMKKR